MRSIRLIFLAIGTVLAFGLFAPTALAQNNSNPAAVLPGNPAVAPTTVVAAPPANSNPLHLTIGLEGKQGPAT